MRHDSQKTISPFRKFQKKNVLMHRPVTKDSPWLVGVLRLRSLVRTGVGSCRSSPFSAAFQF